MTKRIFYSILLIATAVLLGSFVIVMGYLYSYYQTVEENHLKDELRLAAYAVEQNGQIYLEGLTDGDFRSEYRLTWIASDGTVLFDTKGSSGNMENHGDRVEVQEAFVKGEGSSVRYSSTLTEKTLY